MLSTTSSQQQQQQQQQRNSGGRRQPFGFLNSNTLSTSTTAKGILDISGGSGTSNNSSSSTKKNMRGILKSLVTRGTSKSIITTMAKGKKNELLAEKKKTNDFDVKEVSTEKKEEEGEKKDATPSGNVDGIADSNNNVTTTNGSVFFASDNDGVSSSSIFRKEERDVSYGFWNGDGDDENEDLEDMWEIKSANPIFDSIDDSIHVIDYEAADGVEQSAVADMIPDVVVSKLIEKILYDNDRVREDSKHGFKIHIDQ